MASTNPILAQAPCGPGTHPDSLVAKAKSLTKVGGQNRLEAIEVLNCAIKNAKANDDVSPKFLTENYFRLGYYYEAIGLHEEATQAYLNCLLVYQGSSPSLIGDTTHLVESLNAIAIVYSELAEFDKSLLYARQGILDAEKYYGIDDPSIQNLYVTAANIFLNPGDFLNAKRFATQALRIARAPKNKDPEQIAAALGTFARIYQEQGMLDSALFYAQQALPLLPKTSDGRRIAILQIYAQSLVDARQYAAAIAQFQTAITIADSSRKTTPRDRGILYVCVANAWQEIGSADSALQFYQAALMQFLPQFRATSPDFNPEKNLWNAEPWLFEVLKGKAECFEALSRLDKALDCYSLEFEYIDYLRKGFSTEEAREILANISFQSYERAIGLAVSTYQSTQNKTYLEKAFAYIERSKTNAILESLQEIEEHAGARSNPHLFARYRLQKSEIARLLAADHSAQNDRQLTHALQTQDSIYQLLFPITRKQDKPLATLDAVQARLNRKEEEVFVEYFVGEKTIYLLVIDSSHYDCYTVPKTKSFDDHVRDLVQSLSLPPAPGNDSIWEQFAPHAHYLYQKLIGTIVASKFAERPPKLLTIVPDGRLALFPFECLLVTDDKGTLPFVTADYLGRHCAIRYGQSASTLAAQGARHTQERDLKGVLALAPNPDSTAQLMHTKAEVKAAAKALVESKVLIGNDASKKALFRWVRDYRILHLACHATADTAEASRSWFALEKSNNQIDSLFAYEIYGDTLNSDLVVLSACGTGKGRLQTGEGVMSLARSFQMAGSPTTVMSLWSLEDVSTSSIMGYFYEQLALGHSASQSLQAGHNAYLISDKVLNDPEKAHPFYWAAMVAVGADGPHLQQYNYPWTRYLIWGFLVAFIIALWQRRSRRRRTAERRR